MTKKRENSTYAAEGNYSFFGEFDGGVQSGIGLGADWNKLARYVNPVETALLSGGSVYITDLFTSIEGLPIYLTDGTVGTPALGWQNDRDSVLYRLGSRNFGWSVGAVLKYDWNATRMKFASGFSLGINTEPSAPLHILKTTEQMRLAYDATHYAAFTVDSNGVLSISTTTQGTLDLIASGAPTDYARFSIGGGSLSITATDRQFIFTDRGENDGVPVYLQVYNTDSGSATAHALIEMQVDPASNADPYLRFRVDNASSFWSFGLDNSDSDSCVLSRGSTLGTNNRLKVDTTGNLYLPIYTTGSVLFIGASGQVSQNNAAFFWDNANKTLALDNNSALPYITHAHVGNSTSGQFIYKWTTTEASTKNWNLIACEKINPIGGRNNTHFKLGYNINRTSDKPEDTSDYSVALCMESSYRPVANNLAECYFEFLTASVTPTSLRPWFSQIDSTAVTCIVNHAAEQHTWFLSNGTTQLLQLTSTVAQLAIHAQVAMSDALTTPLLDLRQSSTGDTLLVYTLFGGATYGEGIDNSDSDKWKVSYGSAGSATLGTNDRLTLDTSGGFTVVQWANVGTSTDASAQGTFSAGLTGSARVYFDAAGTYNFYSASAGGSTARVNIQAIGTGTSSADFRLQNSASTTAYDWLFQAIGDDGRFRIYDNAGASTGERLVIDQSGNIAVGGGTAGTDSAVFYISGKASTSGEMEINGALNHDGTTVGLYAKAPAAQGTGGENVTNNVTDTASTAGTIPDITNGTVYATDYTNLRNALFQLARMLKQDHDQLRAMGILT